LPRLPAFNARPFTHVSQVAIVDTQRPRVEHAEPRTSASNGRSWWRAVKGAQWSSW
jgi:hypothetical protein